jgi:trimeric autotransporter adhesin
MLIKTSRGLVAALLLCTSPAALAGPLEEPLELIPITNDGDVVTNFNSVKATIDALQAEILRLRALLASVSTHEVYGQPTVRFTDVNVQIVNGDERGRTASANGRGNLILGYDAPRYGGSNSSCSVGRITTQTDCINAGASWSHSHKSGSHYLVIGDENNYSQWGGLVVGWRNTSSGEYASVTGGMLNTASGHLASVSGGQGNRASGSGTSVTGGVANTASGGYASVSGGRGNRASGGYASVTGGTRNNAGGSAGTSVSGGYGNTASGSYASVSGGANNTASGEKASVSGGGGNLRDGNTASGPYASVGGGQSNTASGEGASVSGGQSNTASGPMSSVFGFLRQNASAQYQVLPTERSAVVVPGRRP